jgi:hypothetical protein
VLTDNYFHARTNCWSDKVACGQQPLNHAQLQWVNQIRIPIIPNKSQYEHPKKANNNQQLQKKPTEETKTKITNLSKGNKPQKDKRKNENSKAKFNNKQEPKQNTPKQLRSQK